MSYDIVRGFFAILPPTVKCKNNVGKSQDLYLYLSATGLTEVLQLSHSLTIRALSKTGMLPPNPPKLSLSLPGLR